MALCSLTSTSVAHIQFSPYTSKFTLPQRGTCRKRNRLWTTFPSDVVDLPDHRKRSAMPQNSVLWWIAYRG